MTETLPLLNPLSRDPDLQFRDVQVHPYEASIPSPGGAEILGTVSAITERPGYAPTPMHYRLVRINGHYLLGQRCGLLHTPHLNARHQAAETLWCTNCWADNPPASGKGTLIIPFYLYYRHYEDHILAHLPPCPGCGARFQVWDLDEPLKPDHAYLFSAYTNAALQKQVETQLAVHSNGSA